MLKEPLGRSPGIVIVSREEKFMRCLAGVKCYQCSRTCGEVRGLRTQDLDLRRVQVDVSTNRCGLEPGRPFRCGRCGGNIYWGDVECVYGYEIQARD